MRLFSEHSYEDVSVDDIAAKAGVAKGLLYYYFGNKRGLYATGLERVATEMREYVLAATSNPGLSPVELLNNAFDAHLAFVEQRAAGYRALLGSVSAHPEVRAVLERERAFHRESIEARLPPEVPRCPAVSIALRGWLHFVDGAVFAWLEQSTLDRVQIRELCTGVLIGALETAIRTDHTRTSAV